MTVLRNTDEQQAPSSRFVLSPPDTEQSSCLPKAPTSAAWEGLGLILEAIKMVKTQMVSLSSWPDCISCAVHAPARSHKWDRHDHLRAISPQDLEPTLDLSQK